MGAGFGEEFLQQFGLRLARLLSPALPAATVQAAILQVIAEARAAGSLTPNMGKPSGDGGHNAAFGGRKLELVFAHDCRNHGCNVSHCVLCKHNPNKRCSGNFAHKYWVGDRLLAKCDGEIQVELIDTDTHQRVMEDLSYYMVEACVLEGAKYNTKCREVGEQRLDILDECEVLLNQKHEPLLISSIANNTASDPRVVLKFPPGSSSVPLRELKVTESSESVLAGTKRPPFRLVVRLVAEDGTRVPVRPAVSEEFVVVTKRTKNLKKQEIPSLDDPIAKLNHVGKETVKKLNELKASADEMMINLGLPHDLDRITKVKDFLQLARMSEADGHLQQKLKQLLKLSKEKWDAACEHAKTAVQVDNRMRAWYEPSMSLGLLYLCSLGDVRPDCPVALIQNRRHQGQDFMEVIPMEHQMPKQREQVQETCEQAIQCWWKDSHPGWMIFTLGNKHFETLDQIIQFSRSEQRPEAEAGEVEDERGEAPFRRRHMYQEQAAPVDSTSSRPSEPNRSSSGQLQASNSPKLDATAPGGRGGAPPHLGSQPFPTSQFEGMQMNGGGQQEDALPNPFASEVSLPFQPALGLSQRALAASGAVEDNKASRNSQEAIMTSAAAALAAGNLPSMLPNLFSIGTLAKLGSVPSFMLNEFGIMSSLPLDSQQFHAHSELQHLPPSLGLSGKLPAGKVEEAKGTAEAANGNGKRRLETLHGGSQEDQPDENGDGPELKQPQNKVAKEGLDSRPTAQRSPKQPFPAVN